MTRSRGIYSQEKKSLGLEDMCALRTGKKGEKRERRENDSLNYLGAFPIWRTKQIQVWGGHHQHN